MSALYYPKVTWSGDNHTLTFGTPVDAATGFTYTEMEMARVPGTGEQDSWVDGSFQRARFSFRYVPASGSATDAGWHFPTPGVRAWLAHHDANMGATFTFYPDKDSGGTHSCRVIEWQESREKAQPVLYRVDIVVEDVDGNPFHEY